jgi:hypothetical protein
MLHVKFIPIIIDLSNLTLEQFWSEDSKFRYMTDLDHVNVINTKLKVIYGCRISVSGDHSS